MGALYDPLGIEEPEFQMDQMVFADDWADEVFNESESQVQGETKGVGPAAKHKAKPHNLLGKRSLMIWYHSVRKAIPLWYTLVISFLVCHLAMEPILSTDIIKWTLKGKLPYFAAFVEIGEQIGPPINTCPLSSSHMFGPIHAITVQKMESLTATMKTRRGVETNMQDGQYDMRWNEGRHVNVNNKWQQNSRFEYRRRREDEGKEKYVNRNKGMGMEANVINTNNEKDNGGSKRFTLLNSLINDEELIPNIDQRKIVDEFLRKKNDNNSMGMNGWTEEMKSYFDKHKQVKKLIQEEGLQLCAILETHVKYKNTKKTCEIVFGNWEYITNGEDNNKGCIIMVGWNANKIQAWLISQSGQYILLLKIVTGGIPWVILGDYNVTLKVSEHSNRSAIPSSKMSEFQDCVNNIEVGDLHSEGFHYTWTKSLKNPKCKTLKKLDRVMVNENFMDKFQQAHGMFLPYMISDHSSIIVRIPNGVQKRKSSFRFSNFITDKKEFLPTKYGDVFERAEKLREKVKECQKEVDMFPHDERIKDKSRIILKETIKEIVRRGRIMSIRNEEGVRFENDDVSVQIVKHFEEFLGKSSQLHKMSCRNDIFKNKLTSEEALKMMRPISDSEIKNAMFEIKDSKAPGPDGYTSRFYKLAWSIVRTEVSQAVREFFLTGKLLGEVNATLISLVPKIPTSNKVSDFRPIACCNVLYKFISKIMTNRIKEVLGKLVSENQSAFIGGRQINDNILLPQELFRGYNGKQKVKKVSFKIDLQKAYDTISWEFLKDALVMFGFHKKMFSSFSGLIPNMEKSTVFFRGLSNAEQQNILNIIPFLVGKLPISSMQIYWASVFLLPKQVIYEINKLLKGFLWCQGELTRGKAKIQVPNISDENEDNAVWIARDGQEKKFKINNVWKDMVYSDINVNWFSMVWFAQSIPRHAFVTWLAIKKRTYGTKLVPGMETNDDLKCALCNKCPDSHLQPFFTCEFSNGIWKELLKMMNVKLSECWDHVIDEMKVLPSNKNIWSIVRRLVCGTAVYYIWQERNNRLFRNEKRDINTIINIAKEAVGMKLLGIKVKESGTVKEVEERWNVKMQRG
ncbi:RNA-directed DNA polymerase, eukaryota, reverse transcriptase zinc-binding domain protein [Tanacetum coccineum]